jgi:Na+/H+ antiporter NhaC
VLTVLFAGLATTDQVIEAKAFSWSGVFPYAAILILAIAGMNVFAVLLLGIVLAALQGVFFADYAVANLGKDIFKGFGSMQEIFLLSMFVGALGEFVKAQGGLAWIAGVIDRLAKRLTLAGNKAQQLAIATLVFISNLCIANNTVAIVLAADVSRDLAEHHEITPKRSASLLDIFSCISQGLVPYGAQALLLGASFSLSPWDVVTQSYYCLILLAVALGVILLRPARGH